MLLSPRKLPSNMTRIMIYKKYSKKNDVFGYTSLSLAYSSQLIGQDLDATDCCHMALTLDPAFDKAKELLKGLETKLQGLGIEVREFLMTHDLITTDLWFKNYLNPFELFQLELEPMSDLKIKDIQKAKKISYKKST